MNDFTLDISQLVNASTRRDKLVAACSIWSQYATGEAGRPFVRESAIGVIAATDRFTSEASPRLFLALAVKDDVYKAIEQQLNADHSVVVKFRRYVDMTTRSIVSAMAYRIIAEEELREFAELLS